MDKDVSLPGPYLPTLYRRRNEDNVLGDSRPVRLLHVLGDRADRSRVYDGQKVASRERRCIIYPTFPQYAAPSGPHNNNSGSLKTGNVLWFSGAWDQQKIFINKAILPLSLNHHFGIDGCQSPNSSRSELEIQSVIRACSRKQGKWRVDRQANREQTG